MECFKHLLDLSDHPQNHKVFDSTNKKVPLTMKDELNGQIMMEATCLRSKLYSIKHESGGLKQSAKGVQKCVQKTLHHDLFNDVLSSRGNNIKNVTQLQSQQHQMLVTQINKIVISVFDDKRFILEDGIQSFAYGHYSCEQTSTFCNVFFGCTEFSLEHYRILSFNIV